MVEFRTEYYTPMDRGYHERAQLEPVRPMANIEEPILPIAQLGQTVPEHDPSGRFKNIVQNVQAAIRGGTGNIQLVFQTPIESAIGGRPKAYGEEVRKAIKEVAMANEVAITGFEMPTSLTNLSGWDQQRGVVDENKRQRDLDEVKEMIRFAAETGQGGGVDIISWEYDRPIHRATWLDPKAQDAFRRAISEEEHVEQIKLVDQRSGQIIQIPIRENIMMFRDKNNFEKTFDPLKGETPQSWGYDDFVKFVKWKHKKDDPNLVLDEIKSYFLDNQIKIAEAEKGIYERRLREAQREKERARVQEEKEFWEKQERAARAGIEAQSKTVQEFEERKKNWVDFNKFVLDRSTQSYAEAGMTALQMQDQLGPKNIKKDLYVGPELGWPQFFGSHPKEFAKTILDAREKMKSMLIDQGYSRARAEEEAKRHVKGTFDTSHMGMWLQTFHPELPWNERVEKFGKWYKEQIEWLANENKKHDIIGAIQAVDSAGAGHGHLPPGQGILPVKEAVEILKRKGGFNGYVTSEGHEEEKFGEGRILLKTWQHFNAPFTTGYRGGGLPVQRWGDVQHGYFGRTYSPQFLFGAYAPSNEFKLWSEVPLE